MMADTAQRRNHHASWSIALNVFCGWVVAARFGRHRLGSRWIEMRPFGRRRVGRRPAGTHTQRYSQPVEAVTQQQRINATWAMHNCHRPDHEVQLERARSRACACSDCVCSCASLCCAAEGLTLLCGSAHLHAVQLKAGRSIVELCCLCQNCLPALATPKSACCEATDALHLQFAAARKQQGGGRSSRRCGHVLTR